MKQRISVALATYNGEKYIEKQLQSIFHQTQKVDEIIVYDDQSEDETVAIVKQFQLQDDIVVKLFHEEQHSGYIKNFANALQMTNGNIIFLCDQDDIWEDTKVANIMNIFASNKQIACVNTSFEYVDECNQPIQSEDQETNHGLCWNKTKEHDIQTINYDEIIYHNISMGCTIAFTSVIRDLYLSTSNFQAPHDWEINYLAAIQEGLVFYNEKLIKYRIHSQNTVGNDKLNMNNHMQESSREKNAQALRTFLENIDGYDSYLTKKQRTLKSKLEEFHKKRYSLLSQGKSLIWIKLLRNYSIYKKIVSKKGMILDLIYSLRK